MQQLLDILEISFEFGDSGLPVELTGTDFVDRCDTWCASSRQFCTRQDYLVTHSANMNQSNDPVSSGNQC